MSRLQRLLDQPFETASNRGVYLLVVGGIVLLALVAVFGRHPLLAVATAAYLLSLPAYVGYRIRTWNESLAELEVRTGREEEHVAGYVDAGGNDGDGQPDREAE